MLIYHQTTFDILDKVPQVDQSASQKLKQCEQIFGFSFPLSFREWYSLSHSYEILTEYSNDDFPLSLEELLNVHANWHSYSHFSLNLASQRMLPFLWENQAVFLCVIKLDESDDPPVLLWDDDNEWKLTNKHFSSFISHWVWNCLYFRKYFNTVLRADENNLRETDILFLRSKFKELAQKSPNSTVFHFQEDDKHVHVWKENEQASHWWLRADSRASLLELTQTVWDCGTLATTLSLQGGYIHNDAGKVLEFLRFGVEHNKKR